MFDLVLKPRVSYLNTIVTETPDFTDNFYYERNSKSFNLDFDGYLSEKNINIAAGKDSQVKNIYAFSSRKNLIKNSKTLSDFEDVFYTFIEEYIELSPQNIADAAKLTAWTDFSYLGQELIDDSAVDDYTELAVFGFAKEDTSSVFRSRFLDKSGQEHAVIFDLTNETATNDPSVTGSSPKSYKIELQVDGWYYCEAVFNTSSGSITPKVYPLSTIDVSAVDSNSFTAGKSIYYYQPNAQYNSSYLIPIESDGAVGERASDVFTLAYNFDEKGTIVMHTTEIDADYFYLLGYTFKNLAGSNKLAITYDSKSLMVSQNGSIVIDVVGEFDTTALNDLDLANKNGADQIDAGIEYFAYKSEKLSATQLNAETL